MQKMKKKKKIKKENLSRKVEVDVSGQLGDTKDTVFAFSNGVTGSILILAKTKRLALQYFRLVRTDKTHESFYFLFYIIGLVVLLKPFAVKISDLTLDTELSGQENKIRQALSEKLDNLNQEKIGFKQIGRKSNAHLLAKSVFNGAKPDKVVGLEELKKYLGNKKRSATPKVQLRIR